MLGLARERERERERVLEYQYHSVLSCYVWLGGHSLRAAATSRAGLIDELFQDISFIVQQCGLRDPSDYRIESGWSFSA